ncbi:ribonuclease h [Nannochloropsis gaditana]|uniref:Ribonuclease h n=1 Tax=Nannochloropsis gaditana TaxID=72520 RepID=W7TDC7_9STRA|nr:ribonuclease h [Nannochloropsis gaditana]
MTDGAIGPAASPPCCSRISAQASKSQPGRAFLCRIITLLTLWKLGKGKMASSVRSNGVAALNATPLANVHVQWRRRATAGRGHFRNTFGAFISTNLRTQSTIPMGTAAKKSSKLSGGTTPPPHRPRSSSGGTLTGDTGHVNPYQPHSPFLDQPPAYSHLVFPGGDSKAASKAHQHTNSYLSHVLRLRLRTMDPSSLPPTSSLASPLLAAEGEIVIEQGPGSNARKPQPAWCTQVWVGLGRGEREAVYGLIAQGVAAAQALGLKNLQVAAPSAQVAREICGIDAVAESKGSKGSQGGDCSLLTAHRKIQSMLKFFPFFSVSYRIVKEGHEEDMVLQPVPSLRGSQDGDEEEAHPMPPTTLTPFRTPSTTGFGNGAEDSAVNSEEEDDEEGHARSRHDASPDSPVHRASCPPSAPLPARSHVSKVGTGMRSMSPIINPTAQYLLRFDGGSRGNPGPGGAGIVIYEQASLVQVRGLSLWLGSDPPLTNNEAEYHGLVAGLRAAKTLGIRRICVEGDSQLVVRQILGVYKVRNERLRVLYSEAMALKENFAEFSIRHVERSQNSDADALANRALDEQCNGTFDSGGLRLDYSKEADQVKE